ncbi:hypothetical protein GHT06_019002 [Daphnia sinensis]|uniref:Uncharacterized protein n=1 Tax=Daphnia sinensis TaxID=1820382 RepID=A0AAD5L032_9CRUS|nr:hypothetical protein GHT06_019002 [Daphnia sinensis]
MEIEARSKQKLQILAVNSIPDWIFKKESPGKAFEVVKGVEERCLCVHEIAVAENFILKLIQKKAFAEIYESLQRGKPQAFAEIYESLQRGKPQGSTHPSDWKSSPGLKRAAHRSAHLSSIKREDC